MFKSLFGKKDGDSKQKSKQLRGFEKLAAKASNSKIKPEDRQPALYALNEMDSDASVVAMLSRFNFNYTNNMISDEEEKKFVFVALKDRGDSILSPLKTYLLSAPSISWGLKLLSEVTDTDTSWPIIDSILEQCSPDYERDPSKKHQLLTFLQGFDHAEVPSRVVPFIEDHDENCRFAAISALKALTSNDSLGIVDIKQSMLSRFAGEDEESGRIRTHLAECIVDKKWSIKSIRDKIEDNLPNGFKIADRNTLERTA